MHFPISMLCRQLRPVTLMALITTSALLLPAGGLQASAGTQQLDSFIQDVETFQADFEQTLYDEDSAPLQTSTGTISLK